MNQPTGYSDPPLALPSGTEFARPFLPSRDFELSKRFYEALGFEKLLDSTDVAIFRAGLGGFLLQRRYQRDWAENCRALRGSRLRADGKVVSRRSITDGPFAESKELVGGYWFFVADSLEEAAALGAENPCLAFGLTLEIRPLDEAKALATDTTNETPDTWRVR